MVLRMQLVNQQQHQGDDEGDAEEHHHHHQAVDQVADLLGEADDVDLDVGVLRLELVADLVFSSWENWR
jgi:hypothetical protein